MFKMEAKLKFTYHTEVKFQALASRIREHYPFVGLIDIIEPNIAKEVLATMDYK